MKKTKYEIFTRHSGWIMTKVASEQKNGWLHYELRDGTNGLARPGTWRTKGTK